MNGQFEPGNNLGKGAPDKSMKLSTWIDIYLDEIIPDSAEKYGEALTYRKVLAKKLINTSLEASDPGVILNYIKEIADRTEGKPKQAVDVTSQGERLEGLTIIKE